jgi:two-component system, NarL family, nitrate/nitrite response regulator NarL
MDAIGASEANGRSALLGALIVSEVRFLRESLAEILRRAPEIAICGQSATLAHAVTTATARHPAIVLLDGAFPEGMGAVATFSAICPRVSVVAIAITETADNVLAWAQAGAVGYVPNTASVDELVLLIREICRGEQSCPSLLFGRLLRRIATKGLGTDRDSSAAAAIRLTSREIEILHLIGQGLCNKDIARRLGISLGTTKSHVHHLLAKLNVQSRSEAISRLHAGRPPATEGHLTQNINL